MAVLSKSQLGSGLRRRALRRAAGVLALLWGLAAAHATEIPREYQIKAAFLYNFTKFVDWPDACFASDAAPIVIGVLGDNPFGEELEAAVRARRVHGRPLIIRFVRSVEDIAGMHLVFVPRGEEARFEAACPSPIDGLLTVGESAPFAARGGMITFQTADDKVRFEINVGAAERAGLKISAQLLKLAVAPNGKNGKSR